ncbi:MAG: hypothetical protein AAFN12_15195, partial [Cyanobacteria bacterium J06560_2]
RFWLNRNSFKVHNKRLLKGFFVQDADYTFVEIDKSGWALICVDDAVCHYVDPDNLLTAELDAAKAV